MDGLPDTSRRPAFDRPPETRRVAEAVGVGSRKSGASGRGALLCVLLGVVVLAAAVILLVSS